MAKPQWMKGLVVIHWVLTTIPVSLLLAIFLVSVRAAILLGKFPELPDSRVNGSIDDLLRTTDDGIFRHLVGLAEELLTLFWGGVYAWTPLTGLMSYLQYRYTPLYCMSKALNYGLLHILIGVLGYMLMLWEPTGRLYWFMSWNLD